MKASIDKADIVLPFSRASEAAGFFFGGAPKSGIDFSLLKCISTAGTGGGFQGLRQRPPKSEAMPPPPPPRCVP